MNYFIGLDAHSKSCTAVVVNEKGDILLRDEFKTTESNLVGFVRSLPVGKKCLTFEESTLAQWIYITLIEEVDELLVCNPVYIAKKQGAKTDYRDALHLAQELRTNHLKPVYHDVSKWIELRVLVHSYLDLVQEIVRTKNRLKAVFRSEAINTDSSNFYVDKSQTKLLSTQSSKFVAESLFSQIEALEKFKVEYKEYFKRNIKRHKPIRNLTSVPGIDLVRANLIMAIVCMPSRFKNKHQFWGYCMLVRHIQVSGGKIYGNKRIHGQRELRDVFLGAAETVLRTETSLRTHYDSLRAAGVNSKDAKISVARKIAAICLCLLKNNSVYQDDYSEQQIRRVETNKKLNLERAV